MVAHVSTSLTDTPRLLTHLSKGLVGELRAYLADHRARLEQSLATKNQGFETARAYAKLYDGVLSSLFGACHAAMPNGRERTPMSLAAVGSYGRNTLSPHSDLDVRLVCGADPAMAAPMAEALLYPLWDAGVSIGHQVVTRDDLMELAFEDVATATTLLDFRTITGDAALGQELLERAYQTVFSTAHLARFVDDLQARAAARHQRFGYSVYLLEPDLKNGAGGLRDLDTAHWCARARFRVSDLSELVSLGILLPRDAINTDVIVRTHITTTENPQYCFQNLENNTYNLYFADSLNHRATTESSGVIEFTNAGNFRAEFGAVSESPFREASTFEEAQSEELDMTSRLVIATIGSLIVLLFMLGLGIIIASIMY